MNNAHITIETQAPPSHEEQVSLREGELVKLLEAIRDVESTEAWSTLKTHVFDGEIARLNRLLLSESKKLEVNPNALYRLQGQIVAAKRYDLVTLAEAYRLELRQIKK